MKNIGGTKMQFDIGLGFMGLMLKENDRSEERRVGKECKTYFSQLNFLLTTIADKTYDCKIIPFLSSKDHQFCKKT